MREIRHKNLNAFVGACVDQTGVCIVTDYCDKGSLCDILENDDYKLDSMFVASLVFDLIKVSAKFKVELMSTFIYNSMFAFVSGNDFSSRFCDSLPRSTQIFQLCCGQSLAVASHGLRSA